MCLLYPPFCVCAHYDYKGMYLSLLCCIFNIVLSESSEKNYECLSNLVMGQKGMVLTPSTRMIFATPPPPPKLAYNVGLLHSY